ncbi:right-handed parallel beta-helix repeat-containing protein [Pseudonocardia lacus]|uniref:right-handed parallel beta-helix repeat-containing protein n=1 Tax=Pseudonocardia lacus TaxID=2835865 RepID=UPI001BDC50CC|nr:right-handed parallel beta-helix repeat-containing protein [Pseudonocardia lacus]
MSRGRLLALGGAALLAAGCQAGPSPPAASAAVGVTQVRCANGTGDADLLNTAIRDSPPGADIAITGTCSLTEPVELRGGRSYHGPGRDGAVLRQADGANLPFLLASDSFVDSAESTGRPVTLRGLSIDGNRDGNPDATTDGVVIRSWQTTLEDLRIQDVTGSAVRITNLGRSGEPTSSTQVNGRIANCFIEGSGASGVRVEDGGNAVTDWQLLDSWIAGSGGDAVHLENAAGWIISRNHLYGVGGDGIRADRAHGTTVTDNYIEGFGEDGTGTFSGISLSAQSSAGSTIAGNRVFLSDGQRPSSTYRHIHVDARGDGQALVAVTGNVVRGDGGPGGTGLAYERGDGAELVVVSSGNALAEVATAVRAGDGVTVTAGS